MGDYNNKKHSNLIHPTNSECTHNSQSARLGNAGSMEGVHVETAIIEARD